MIFWLVLFFGGLSLLLLFNSHYVILFLLLEVVLLSVFVYIFYDFLSFCGLAGTFFFLLVVVCLGGFSISLLVSLARGLGRDFWFFGFIF